MSTCIFCDIVNNKAPAFKVFENDLVLSFMDINPVNKGHLLIIPKRHSTNFAEVSDEESKEMFSVARKILKAIQNSSIQCEGANLFLSDGSVAGQDVFHSHLHIVPRFKDDGHRMGFTGVDKKSSTEEVLLSTSNEIKEALKELS